MPKSRRRKRKPPAKARRSGNPGAFENLAVVVDPSMDVVTDAFVAARRRVASPDRLLAQALPAEPVVGEHLDPIEAGEYLNTVRLTLEDAARRLAQRYPPAKWLWYSRRISPTQLAGHLITTELSDHALFETLTGLSNNTDAGEPLPLEGRAIFGMSVADLQPVAQMASLATALARCHGWLRRAGKGTHFIVRDSDLPETVEDADLETAIDVFDERVAADLSLVWHPSIEMNTEGDESVTLLGVTRVIGDWTDVPAWKGRMRDRRLIRLRGQFVTSLITLEGLAHTVAAGGQEAGAWWSPQTPDLVVLLHTLWFDAALRSDQLGVALPKVGYSRRERRYAEAVIDEMLEVVTPDVERLFPGHVPQSGADVISGLMGLGPELWPAQMGPVIRDAGADSIVIDVWAASARLQHDLVVPSSLGGEIVNAPSFQFETATQQVIDATSWRPSETTRALLRGHLRVAGNNVTDIDAVGERDGALLIVSCKNVLYTPAYDAGDHRTVRNVTTTVDKAVTFWRTVVRRLRASPVGDNFDVSAYTSVHGVVVTPRVAFSRDADTLGPNGPTELALRGAVSLGELRRALGREP